MRASVTLFNILLLATFLLVPGRSVGSADLFEQGLSQLSSNRYDEAVKTFSSAIALTPDHAAAFCNRGVAWFYQSDHDRAIADFTKALEINPRYAMAYCNRGLLWTEKADYDRAIADFNKALEIDSGFVEAFYGRAVAWFLKGDDDRAIADVTKAFEQGLLQLSSNRYDEAVKTFSSAIALTPDDAAAFCNRGVAWFYQSDHDRAIADFTKALEINPRYAMAYCNRGILWTEKADYDRAIADFNKALEIDPGYVEAFYGRAVAWFLKGDDDRAIADVTKAVEINPDDAAAFSNRGVFWNRKTDYDRAIADFTKAMEINPRRPEAFAQLAWILATCPDDSYRNGARAVTLAQTAVQLAPEPRFMATLAAAYAESGKFEDAINTQKKVIAPLTEQGRTKDLAEYKRQLESYEAHRPWRTNISQTEDLERPAESSKPSTPATGQETQTVVLSAKEKESSTVSDKQQTLPGSLKWVYSIQVGAFRVRENAERLTDLLQKTGYPSHLLSNESSSGTLWHFVLVGKYATLKNVEKAAADFSAKEKMPTSVYVAYIR
jgi:tetratricopeptide (TPR) repeat protein